MHLSRLYFLSCATFSFAMFEISCEQYHSIETKSGKYTYGTDQWGLDDSGYQCMNVTLDDTQAGSTSTSYTTSFYATWLWAGTSFNRTTVHAFPNVALNSAQLPLQIRNLSALTVSLEWSMTPGQVSNATTFTNVNALERIDVAADVAIDLWFDTSASKSNSSTNASTEVMIWQASYGNVRPIGFTTPGISTPTYSVAGTTYTLYKGSNDQNQTVFTWYPNKNLTTIRAVDVSPLIHYLWRHLYLDQNLYLGLVQWGSEAIHSAMGENVTFWAREVSLDVEIGVVSNSKAMRRIYTSSALSWGCLVVLYLALG